MTYDLLGAIDSLFPGIVVQETLIQAAETYWLAKGSPLDSSDVTAILTASNVLNAAQVEADYVPSTQPNYPTTLPTYPTGLPRFPDGYGGMQAPDGWSIVAGGKVVNP
jgi:hypothetical protein